MNATNSGRTINQPFGFLSHERFERREFVRKLLSVINDQELFAYIISERPRLIDSIRFNSILMVFHLDIAVYFLNKNSIATGHKFMLSHKLWHPTRFHIIFANKAFEDILKAYCKSNHKVNIIEFEMQHQNEIFFTVEFVDDDALFYGNDNAHQRIKEIFSDLEQL